MTSLEDQLEILFDHRQDFSFREIARRNGCDPRTAKKYIEHPELIGKRRKPTPRPSIVDPFLPQIKSYLEEEGGDEYRASWIYDQIRKCGYEGCYEMVKCAVRKIKGTRQQLAYLRFETEPGRQAQVDYGEFQAQLPDGSVKTYYLFLMMLGYSRRPFACLLERCDLPGFLEAHIAAFDYFGGVPQEILYDRMRNVFVRVTGGKAQFTQGLMTMATHYGFVPRVAPAYAAWVKGKVENPINFVREGFWRGYSFSNLVSANRDLSEWLAEKEQRIHGTTHERIDLRFEREKPHLLALPPCACDVSLRLTRTVAKDCQISVEANRYVVEHTLVGQKVTVRLKDTCLRVFADDRLVVTYEVPQGKGHVVEDPRFYAALRADKKMQERKYGAGRGQKGKGKVKGRAKVKPTISPIRSKYPVDVEPISVIEPYTPSIEVERRSIDVYARLGGEVCYA